MKNTSFYKTPNSTTLKASPQAIPAACKMAFLRHEMSCQHKCLARAQQLGAALICSLTSYTTPQWMRETPLFVPNQETAKIVDFYGCVPHELAMSQQQFA